MSGRKVAIVTGGSRGIGYGIAERLAKEGYNLAIFGTSDERTEEGESFHYEGGIISFVEYLNKNRAALFSPPIYISGEKGTSSMEVALQYNDSYVEGVYSFANNIDTHEGGTHLSGFRAAITRVLNDYGRKYNYIKQNEPNLSGEDTREGLTAIISVKLTEPQFEGQTKTKLGNSEIRGFVESTVGEGLSAFLEENPSIGKIILEKALTASIAVD